MRTALALLLLLLLPGCCDDRPPGPTSEQSDRLNEAEALLNELDEEKGPEANASGPSS